MTVLVDFSLHCKQGAPYPRNYVSSGLVCKSSHARDILCKLTLTFSWACSQSLLVWSRTPPNSGENKPSAPGHGLWTGVRCTAHNCTFLITSVEKLLVKTAWEIRACTSQKRMLPDNDPSDAAVNFPWHLSTQITLRRDTVSQPCLSVFLAILLRLLERQQWQQWSSIYQDCVYHSYSSGVTTAMLVTLEYNKAGGIRKKNSCFPFYPPSYHNMGFLKAPVFLCSPNFGVKKMANCTWIFRLSLYPQWPQRKNSSLLLWTWDVRAKERIQACLLWATFLSSFPSELHLTEGSTHKEPIPAVKISRLWPSGKTRTNSTTSNFLPLVQGRLFHKERSQKTISFLSWPQNPHLG